MCTTSGYNYEANTKYSYLPAFFFLCARFVRGLIYVCFSVKIIFDFSLHGMDYLLNIVDSPCQHGMDCFLNIVESPCQHGMDCLLNIVDFSLHGMDCLLNIVDNSLHDSQKYLFDFSMQA